MGDSCLSSAEKYQTETNVAGHYSAAIIPEFKSPELSANTSLKHKTKAVGFITNGWTMQVTDPFAWAEISVKQLL